MTSPAAWALHTDASLDDVNVHLAALQDLGLLGIVEEEGRSTVYLAHRADNPPVDGTWEPVAERDWHASWKAQVQPVTAGDVTIVAPWHEVPPDTAVLVIEPGQAFGTGHHETTTRCLAALRHVPVEGADVLDVGTGSGVLALAAKQRGAARVVAVDVDPVAVRAAQANAAANRLQLDVRQGSAADVDGRFRVVLANLDTATVCAIAGPLAQRLARDGTLIVSGVSNERCAEALRALEAVGLDARAEPGEQWALLTATHR